MTTPVTEPSPVTTRQRWRVIAPFAVVGSGGVVLGGLVAAVTGPLKLSSGSWLAAFLVLVVGVAQIAFGAGRGLLPTALPLPRRVWTEVVAWNLGNLLVIVGTLAQSVWLVAFGSLVVLAALVLFAEAVTVRDAAYRRLAAAYRVLVVFLAVSVAVGMVLSLVRHG